MRLINCSTLTFDEFFGSNIPPYAILSHTWDKVELLFQDILGQGDIVRRKGAPKLIETCRLAKNDGYEYVWIDTCCIDKSSSAELTEAINSMFRWYERSARCYVYLSDFSTKDPDADFSRCRWFSRGWTLQELVAPSDIRFYDKDWTYFGSKAELSAALSSITGIERPILNRDIPLFAISVAKKMSWAAQRETTRVEDIAYCLLGVFGLSMPLVYGEGDRAFTRLQEEIMKETNDLTLFAWQAEASSAAAETPAASYRGILARSPREFAHARTAVSSVSHKSNPDFAMTNKGLRIYTPLIRGPGTSVIMPLNCHRHMYHGRFDTIGIFLVQIGGGVYARDLPQQLATHMTDSMWKSETIYIVKITQDARYI